MGLNIKLPMDHDATDNTVPYSAVGMLSWAITHDVEGTRIDSLDVTLKALTDHPDKYQWE